MRQISTLNKNEREIKSPDSNESARGRVFFNRNQQTFVHWYTSKNINQKYNRYGNKIKVALSNRWDYILVVDFFLLLLLSMTSLSFYYELIFSTPVQVDCLSLYFIFFSLLLILCERIASGLYLYSILLLALLLPPSLPLLLPLLCLNICVYVEQTSFQFYQCEKFARERKTRECVLSHRLKRASTNPIFCQAIFFYSVAVAEILLLHFFFTNGVFFVVRERGGAMLCCWDDISVYLRLYNGTLAAAVLLLLFVLCYFIT